MGLAAQALGFLYQRFSSLVRDEACQFRNQQSRTAVEFGDHSSIRDSWPIAFSGYPRGPSLLNSPGSRIVAQKEIGDAGKDGVPWSTRKEVVPPLF
jgi:hypothetical protein